MIARTFKTILFVLVLAAMAGAAPAVKDVSLPDAKEFKLKNGLRVQTVLRHGVPLVAVRISLPGGAVTDPEGKEGVTSILTAMLPQETSIRSAAEVADQLDYVAASFGGSTRYTRTVYSGEFLSKDFNFGLELMGEALKAPAFNPELFERVRAQSVAGIKSALTDPEDLIERDASMVWYGDHPYGRPVSGYIESLEGMTIKDVEEQYSRAVTPSGALMTIVGEFDPPELKRLVKEHFGDWKGPKPVKAKIPQFKGIEGRKCVILDMPDVTQVSLRFLAPGPGLNDKDYYATDLLSAVLGGGFTSRLNTELRDKRGLTYSAYAYFVRTLGTGYHYSATFVAPDKVDESVGIVLAELQKMAEEKPSEDELSLTGRYLAGSFPISIETGAQVADRINTYEFLNIGVSRINRYRSSMLKASQSSHDSLRKQWFGGRNVMIVATGDPEMLTPVLEKYGEVEVVKPR